MRRAEIKLEKQELAPILVKNPEKSESSKSFINMAPFFDSLDFVNGIDNNPISKLGEFVGNLAKIVATCDLEEAMVIEGMSKEEIVYTLFYLESGCKKSTLVNL